MPELPEVESLRRGLARHVLGQKIKSVTVSKPKLVSGKGNVRRASPRKTREFIDGLTGRRIKQIYRRAKNLIFYLAPQGILLVHLKMTGQLIYREHNRNAVVGGHPIELSETKVPNQWTHITFELERGTLFYNDPRQFGYLLFYPDQKSFEVEEHFASIGLEPFDRKFTPKYLQESLAKKSGRLKSVLMDQTVVTGLGNIYCDEVCFTAGIRPMRPANKISKNESDRLYTAIKKILPHAIKLGGSSVANYRLADGSRGNYAREHKVYGRGGLPCLRCGRKLLKTTVQNRTTIYCPVCQR